MKAFADCNNDHATAPDSGEREGMRAEGLESSRGESPRPSVSRLGGYPLVLLRTLIRALLLALGFAYAAGALAQPTLTGR